MTVLADQPDDFRLYGGRLAKFAFWWLALRIAGYALLMVFSIVSFFVIMAHGIGPSPEQRAAGIAHSQEVFDAMVARQHHGR